MPIPTFTRHLTGRDLIAQLADALAWGDRRIHRVQIDADVNDVVRVTVHEFLVAGEESRLIEAVSRYRLDPIEADDVP